MSGPGQQDLLARIEQRLAELETRLAGGPRIRLQCSNPDALLGQESIILAQLRGADGRPLVDTELTAFCSWGLLSGRAGLQRVEGNSVTVRSDHLGLCRLRLAAASAIHLTEVERASLGRALAGLGNAAGNPRDSAEQLATLTAEYRAPGNDALRRAVDAYYQRHGSGNAADAPIDSLSEWPQISIAVFAWLTPAADPAGAQVSAATLNIRQRNWFYAWLWAYRLQLQQGSTLEGSLGDIRGDERSGSGILTDMFSRIDTFMAAQDGLVGQDLGRRFAAENLNRFLETGLAKVPQDERAKVLTGVTGGVTSLATEPSFSNERIGRAGFSMELESRIAGIDPAPQIDELAGRVSRVEVTAITRDDIGGLRADILAATREDSNTRFDELSGRIAELGRNTVTRDDLTSLRADILAATREDSNARFDELSGRIAELGRNTVTRDDLGGLQQRLGRLEETTFSRDDAGRLRSEILEAANRNSAGNLDRLRRDLDGRITAVTQRVDRIDRVTPVTPVGPVGPVGPVDPRRR